MENVHGFSENRLGERDENNGPGNGGMRGQRSGRRQAQAYQNQDVAGNGLFSQRVSPQNIVFAETHRVMFISGRNDLKHPLDENYWDMLKNTFCPVLNCISLTSLLVFIDTVLFIVTVSMGLDANGSFLQINTSTLLKFGANSSKQIYGGQVYRLIAPIFLHLHFMHYLGNIVTTLIICSRVEHCFGWLKTLIVYIISGIGANIFSALINYSTIKVGASTSLFGLLGAVIGYLIINWNGVDGVGNSMKCKLLCSVVTMIIFVIIFTLILTNASVDYYGHLGGFMCGLWLSSIHTSIVLETRQKVIRGIFFSLIVIQLLVCFLVFYLQPNPAYA